MEKYIFDERNGLWYELQGDYYLPCLKLPEGEHQSIGLWGQGHLRHIKQNRKIFYTNLLTSGNLNGYLADIDHSAEKMLERLVKQMSKADGITEELKAANQMAWVKKMNAIRNAATEIINKELILA